MNTCAGLPLALRFAGPSGYSLGFPYRTDLQRRGLNIYDNIVVGSDTEVNGRYAMETGGLKFDIDMRSLAWHLAQWVLKGNLYPIATEL